LIESPRLHARIRKRVSHRHKANAEGHIGMRYAVTCRASPRRSDTRLETRPKDAALRDRPPTPHRWMRRCSSAPRTPGDSPPRPL
jgi:hypothetical protein